MEKPITPRKPYKSRTKVNSAIVANLSIPKALRPKWPEVAETLGVDVSLIYDQINRLRKRGVLPPMGEEFIAAAPPFKPASPKEAKDYDRLLEATEAQTDMPEAKRRERLTDIINFGSDQNKNRAIEILNSMDRAKDRGIGPPIPMTPEQRVARLSDLMRACGPETSKKAMEVAFGSKQEARDIKIAPAS
jgi:hypothetical protein